MGSRDAQGQGLAEDAAARLALAVETRRVEQDITKAELARRAGMALPNVHRFVRGSHTPTIETVVRIAKGLGVKPSVLFSVLD